MAKEVKNQHFLPRAYLSGFTADPGKYGDRHVLVYRSRRDILSWEPQPTKSTASGPYRHSYRKKGGGYDHRPDEMLEEIENRSFPILAKLRKMAALSADERSLLSVEEKKIFAEFVMHMYMRTPPQTETTVNFLNKLEEWRHALHEQYWAGSENELARVAYNQRYPDGTPSVAETPYAIEETLEPFLKAAGYLRSLKWFFLKTTSDFPFITCDSPVVQSHGFADIRCTISMPLSSELAFFAAHGSPEIEWRDIDRDDVKGFNSRTLAAATQMIIASRTDYPGNELPIPDFIHR